MLFLLFAAGCASPRPVLYPNEQFQAAGKEQARQDTDDCIAQARKYVESQKGKTVAKHTGWGAAAGAALGAVQGAFTGDIGKAVAEGAALGGTVGLAHGAVNASEPDAVFRQFVDICLAKKGYQPIGWR